MKTWKQTFLECVLTTVVAAGLLVGAYRIWPGPAEAQAPILSKTMIYDGKGTAIQVAATSQLWDNTANLQAATNLALTGNVVTITTSATHNYIVGQRVVVALLTGPALFADCNGTFVITAVNGGAKTFAYALTHADITTGAATGATTAYYLSPVPTGTTPITLVYPPGAFAMVIIPTTANDATFSYTVSGGIGGTFPLYTGASNVISGQEGDTVYIQRTTTTPLAFQFALGK